MLQIQQHLYASLAAVAALLSAPQVVLAADGAAGTDAGASLGLKPGLWEVDLTYQTLNGRQVLDDQDLFARLLASVDPTTLALDRANTALSQSGCANGVNSGGGDFASRMETANTGNTEAMPHCTLPFAMRMQAEASIRESGANEGANSSFRICLTPALAALDVPVLDAQDTCHPGQVQRAGKRETFTFSCGTGGDAGTALSGKGDSHRTFLGHILTLTDFTATINSKTHYAVHDRTEMKYLGTDCGAVKPPASP
jgi:hypothetical protein